MQFKVYILKLSVKYVLCAVITGRKSLHGAALVCSRKFYVCNVLRAVCSLVCDVCCILCSVECALQCAVSIVYCVVCSV